MDVTSMFWRLTAVKEIKLPCQIREIGKDVKENRHHGHPVA